MNYRDTLKPTLDIAISGLCILLLSPLMAVIIFLIKILDPGPTIFRQQRVGQNGKPFILMKFRSMPIHTGDVPSSEISQIQMTWIGRFIRRCNVDELPQLVNILKGDMSLVGPRPPLPCQEALISLRQANGALTLKPGLTGWAQVNAFDGMSEEKKAALDGIYARDISFIKDLEIIIRTISYLLSPPPKY